MTEIGAQTMARRPHPKTRLMRRDRVERFFDILAEHIDPTPELNWGSPLDLLVAVVLSAQTTDKAVNRVTSALWQHCRSARDYLQFGEARIQRCVKSIGLYRNKTRALVGICQALEDRFGGHVPGTREALQSLPGVGRKTANVVLNVVFGQPTLAVDTHVFRVSNRTGLVCASTPEATEVELLKEVPERYLLHAHHYLLLHGRYTCKARKPECPSCPVADVCNWPEKSA